MLLDKELIKLGLSEKEARVYLGAIQLGSSTVQKISQKSGVNRATTYVIIERLMEMGLMSTFDEGKKTFYVAEKPERLLNYFRNKKVEAAQKIDDLKGIIPELTSLYNDHSDRPRVKYYEGEAGIRAIYKDHADTLSPGEEILVFISLDDFFRLQIEDDMMKARKQRSKNKIKMRIIYNSSKGRDLKYENNNIAGDEFLFIEKELYDIGIGVNVYSNKAVLVDYRGKSGAVMIENEAIAAFLRATFDFVWNRSKK